MITCQECDFEGVQVVSGKGGQTMLLCPNCNMNKPFGHYVVFSGLFTFYQAVDTFEYHFSEADKEIAEVETFTSGENGLLVYLRSESPSNAISLIVHLKALFGDSMVLKVFQTGSDNSFAGCPVCGSQEFHRINPTIDTARCQEHFEINVMDWALSLLYKNHFSVRDELENTVRVIHSYFPADDVTFTNMQTETVAEIELRPGKTHTVLAVRCKTKQFGDIFTKVLETLQVMKLEDFKVMKVK